MKLEPTASEKLTRWLPIVIFVVAFTVRGTLLSRLSSADIIYGHMTANGLNTGDEGINVGVSLSLRGRFADPFCRPTGATAHVPPSFPALTAIVFHVFGFGLAGGIVRNMVNIAGYSILFAILPAAAAALSMSRTVGVLAGFAGALYPAFRSAEVFRGRDEWLAAVLLLWLTVLAFRLSKQSTLRLWSAVAYGAGWGVMMYVQPSAAVIFPIHLIVLLAVHRGKPLLLRVKYVAVAALLMAVVILPWTIRNRRVMGGWLFMRDNLGLELHVSNGDLARSSHLGNMSTGWFCAVHPVCSVAQTQKVLELGELEFNRRDLATAHEWIVRNKGSFLRLTLGRMAYFWTDLPSNRMTFLVRTVLSLASFVGIALMWRDRLRLQVALVGTILLMYPLPYYIVQYSDRYVAVISFALLLPAAFAFNRLVAAASVSRYRRRIGSG